MKTVVNDGCAKLYDTCVEYNLFDIASILIIMLLFTLGLSISLNTKEEGWIVLSCCIALFYLGILSIEYMVMKTEVNTHRRNNVISNSM